MLSMEEVESALEASIKANTDKQKDRYYEQWPVNGVGGIVVSIAAFQAVDPGSIPGRRNVGAFLPLQ